MTKDEAIDKAQEIAEVIGNGITNGTLDDEIKKISDDDWDIYVKVTKSTLDEAFKDDPERARNVGRIYNGTVQRREILKNKGEL